MLEQRIRAFVQLGDFLKNERNEPIIEVWVQKSRAINSWFTANNVQNSLNAIAENFCNEAKLSTWLAAYDLEKVQNPKKIGLVLAGNIPAVGFHDLMCVLLAGHNCLVKTSSQDFVLIKELIQLLKQYHPDFNIEVVEQLKEAEALIATGSDNTAKHFEYYFRNIPHVIRKNRTSVGILSVNESEEDFQALANDITSYFGLGCRNISKVFVPKYYSFTPFLDAIQSFSSIINHHKYLNNYEYNKSIYLVNGVKHFDNGFMLLTENEALVSPISVLFYEEYENEADLNLKIARDSEKIQCIASKNGWFENSVAFGQTQSPQLWDYADGVDTMKFLLNL